MIRNTLVRLGGSVLLTGFAVLAACTVGTEPADEVVARSDQALAVLGAAPSAEGVMSPTKPRAYRPLKPSGGVNPDTSFCQQQNPGANPNLKYYGGPILSNPQIVAVNWGANIPAQTMTTLPLFYQDVMQQQYWDWLSDDYDTLGAAVTGGHASTNQGMSRGTYLESVTITPSLGDCPGSGCTLTDAEIQTELNHQIAIGQLPAPVTGCDGKDITIYMIAFNASVSITNPQGQQSCVAFCGYHGTGTAADGADLVYAVLPDVSTGPCGPQGGTPVCGNSANYIQNATAVASHELIESTTDTEVGLAATVGYPIAWYDTTCGEIGDICAYIDGTITGAHGTWTVQTMWDNKTKNCIATKALLPMCTTSVTTGCRKCTCADNNQSAAGEVGCNGATPWCETSTTDVKAGTCVQCTIDSECTGGTCTKSSTVATDDTCASPPCGAVGQACCGTGSACVSGAVCSGSTCVACGGAGQACCTGNACTAPTTCVGGVCECVPLTSCPAGDNCGTLPDGCGGMLTCGTCTSPQSCGGGSPSQPNQCGCTPATTCPSGDTCGTAPDGCGGVVACGTCGANQTCDGNQCVATPDAGAADSGAGDAGARDSGSVPDASSADSGRPADSGSMDSAVVAEAGILDSGFPVDSGLADSALGADASSLVDSGSAIADSAAGVDGEGDGGAEGGAGSGGNSGGCGCRTAQSRDAGGSPALLALVVLLLGARSRAATRSRRKTGGLPAGEPRV